MERLLKRSQLESQHLKYCCETIKLPNHFYEKNDTQNSKQCDQIGQFIGL